MGKHKHYLKTSIWYKEKIHDPYQVIADTFSVADIDFYRNTITEIVNTAYSADVWSKTDPGNLLFYFKMIESVINSAYLINIDKKKNPLQIDISNLLNKNLYCGYHTSLTEWDYLPRSISKEEYINPYLVLKQFFEFSDLIEWKRILNNLFEYSLTRTSLYKPDMNVSVLSVHAYLTKLHEATHLIDVRENNHVGGIIKSRAS